MKEYFKEQPLNWMMFFLLGMFTALSLIQLPWYMGLPILSLALFMCWIFWNLLFEEEK